MTSKWFRPTQWLYVILLLGISSKSPAELANTRHNLSVSGPGGIKAVSETQTCIFCHAPHNASPSAPLWNRNMPGSTYIPYTSSTTLGSPGQPTGASLMCLSCHDGTIALGDVLTRSTTITMSGGVSTMPIGPGRLGTDLSDDHPVSFAYTSSLAATRGDLADPSTLTGPIRLDPSGQMQCTACHDPHDDSNGKFLVVSNYASALCVTCHTKGQWNAGSHKVSAATWNGSGTDPWPHTDENTVAGNACENCHRPHEAGGRRWLLNHASEEANCSPCHNANVATKDVHAEFVSKPSVHPVSDNTGIHDPTEPAVSQSRHVECVDCHNPHAANELSGALPGSLKEVRGVSAAGAEVGPATLEYEICLRCHGDSPGQPAPPTTRQIAQTNTRLEFDLANPSQHAVFGPGQNPNVPSLIPPLTTSSVISCTDCHNNNAGPQAGGSGPNGPHGSTYSTLLERRYVTTDNTPESASNYALCYKCHDRNAVVFGGSEKVHKKHLLDEDTPCNICHDPHGISSTQGNATNNSRLINFDTDIVSPSGGNLRFESLGTNRGRCYLVCHGKNHDPFDYPG